MKMGYDKMRNGLLVSLLVLVMGFSGCTSWLHSAVIGENEGQKRHTTKSTAMVYEDTLPLTALAGSPQDSELEPIQSFLGESPPYPNLTQGERSGEMVEGSQSSGLQSIFTQSPDSNLQHQEFGNEGLSPGGESEDRRLSGFGETLGSHADSVSQARSDLQNIGKDNAGSQDSVSQHANEGLVNPSHSRDAQEAPFGRGDIVAGLVGEDLVDRFQDVDSGLDQKEITDIFFDFDQAFIREDARSVLETNAELLTTRYENAGLLIEGHCDEWGTSEYNMVLGQRRAEVARRYLVDLGVPSSKVETVSYGEEKPFCARSNSRCWKRNRRSHFVVKQNLNFTDFK